MPTTASNSSPIPIALDLSCLLDPPLTGVGYAALYQVQALHELSHPFDLRMFGARSRRGPHNVPELQGTFSRECVISYARRMKPSIWSRFNWPPIEWFCGNVKLAHDFFHQLPAARNALRTVTIHDLSFIRHPETHTEYTVREQTRLVQHAVRNADALIAVSEFCKRELIEMLDADAAKIHVVPNGVQLADFQSKMYTNTLEQTKKKYDTGDRYFIYLGTIEGRKNIPLLLEAYAALRNKRNDVPTLVLAGKVGWRADASLAAIDKFNLRSSVRQLGHIPRGDAIALLRGALACVYPSIYEGFGLPALEAMAAGTPLIVSDADALLEVVGDTAQVAGRNDPDAWMAALETVLDNSDNTRVLAERAKSRAASFTWKESALQLATVWQNLLKQFSS